MLKRVLGVVFFVICSLFTLLNAVDIAVVTLAVGKDYEEAVAPGIENKRQYCEKHGYDFIFSNEWIDLSRPIPWSKIKLLQEVLKNENYKWIFWTDADAIIMNHGIKLEDIIDDQFDFIITHDCHTYNSGNFLLKNSEWSKLFLEKIYAHEESIHHAWWENHAIIEEIQNDTEVQKKTKVVPQRIMNSYSSEIISFPMNPIKEIYKEGDFIIHFASCSLKDLPPLMNKYSAMTVDNRDLFNLDTFLNYYGFQLTPAHNPGVNEGYCTESQRKIFVEDLKSYRNIKNIAEIGLNAGHSVQTFFENCKDVNVLSFDINYHPYTKVGVEFMQRKYKDRFRYIEGDSLETVPNFVLNNPEEKFDLLYVDGDHTFLGCYQDIVNFKNLAHKNTILWVDDYAYEVEMAVNQCVKEGLIKIVKHHSAWNDPCGPRVWVEARYLFKCGA